jgi:hypothetical protein
MAVTKAGPGRYKNINKLMLLTYAAGLGCWRGRQHQRPAVVGVRAKHKSFQSTTLINKLKNMSTINMKKWMLAIAITGCLGSHAQVRVGVQAGATMSSPTVSGFTNIKNLTNDITPSFGIVAQFNLGGLLAFRPSVNYLQNSFAFDQTAIKKALIPGNPDTLQQIATGFRQNGIEIPLDLVLPVKMGKGKLLFSFAPVITIGLKGDSVSKITPSPGTPFTVNNALNFGKDNFEIKKTGWGTRFGIGCQFKNGIQLNAAYHRGFTNLRNDAATVKNHYASLSLAWFLFK